MNEHNQETYLNLIQALLNCSSKEELELLLNSHKSLITPDFIQVMEQVATQIADAGELEKADFLWILVEDLTQTLAKGMKVVIDRRDRSSAYLHLVNALITCPSGEEVQILNANLDLIDEGLIQTMKEVASQLAAEGEHDNATWLTDTAAQLVTEIEDSSSSTTEEIVNFLWQVLRATYESNRTPQVVYPLLQANLEKFNDKLIPVFSSLVITTLSETKPAQKPGVAAVFFDFCYLIKNFRLGNRDLNLDIAITGLEIVSTVFSRDQFPEEWATIQNNLGTAYQEITQGDLTQNIETSIRYLEAALQVRTREASPEQWAETQNNLGVAYYSRIQGDRVESLELAIAAYEAALQVYTLENFPRDWAELQINLGAAYRERLQGDPDENLELAIAAYEAALQVCTREAFPERWAMIQNNLGVAYRGRSQDDKAKNLEIAIAAYKAALEVYTLENFSGNWALVQNNLGNAYRERKLGNRAENIKNAIATFQSIFRVYTKDDFPYEWARIQNNLGYAYREQGQISRAIACFRAALDIYKPTTFPTECLNAGNGLSDTASLIWLPDDAIEGFAVSIEAVETSRAWANTHQRRQEILSDAMDIYANMVQICINTQQFERALEYVERSKSRNLVDILANRDIYPKGNISKNVINNLQRLRREIVAEQRRLDIVEQNRSSSPISSISQPMRSSAAWLSEHNRLKELLKQLNDLITNEIDPIDPSFKLIQQV
jgi:tetratricopeptide (TPR) repeat protein